MAKQSREEIGNLTVKLDLDASDVISGLKAVQREAKKATQAIRELETAQLDTSEGSVLHDLAHHFGCTPQELSASTSDERGVMFRTHMRQLHDAAMQRFADVTKLTAAEEAQIKELRGLS